jgi:hypothetical protein
MALGTQLSWHRATAAQVLAGPDGCAGAGARIGAGWPRRRRRRRCSDGCACRWSRRRQRLRRPWRAPTAAWAPAARAVPDGWHWIALMCLYCSAISTNSHERKMSSCMVTQTISTCAVCFSLMSIKMKPEELWCIFKLKQALPGSLH